MKTVASRNWDLKSDPFLNFLLTLLSHSSNSSIWVFLDSIVNCFYFHWSSFILNYFFLFNLNRLFPSRSFLFTYLLLLFYILLKYSLAYIKLKFWFWHRSRRWLLLVFVIIFVTRDGLIVIAIILIGQVAEWRDRWMRTVCILLAGLFFNFLNHLSRGVRFIAFLQDGL